MRNPSVIVLLSADSISIVCSLLTLWTIHRVGRWNGYTKLVFHLAFAQLFYDFSTILVPLPGELSYRIYVGYRSIFGMATTLLTNIIAGTVLYTVYYFKPFEVSKHLYSILIYIYIPSIIIGILVSVYVQTSSLEIYAGIYFWVRVISISFNILSYLLAKIILLSNSNIHATYQQNMTQQQLWNTNGRKTPYNDPLRAFIKRFQYYPLIQVICRCGVSWYEFVYGYSYNYHSDDPLEQQILLFIYVLFLPSLGTFYFIIYLTVSPNAYFILSKDIKRLISYLTCGLCCGRMLPNSSQDKSISASGIIEGFGFAHRNLEGEVEGRGTIASLYRHFLSERMSSLERHDTDGISTPLQRLSAPHSSRQVSADPSMLERSTGYDRFDEDELSKEIRRVYEGTPPQHMSL